MFLPLHWILSVGMIAGDRSAIIWIQEGPADTMTYFAAGYIVIFGVMALYLGSLILRRRNMQQDLETLDQLEEKRR